MKTHVINPFIPLQWQQPAAAAPENKAAEGFAGTLHKALGEVNQLQVNADEAAQKLAMGEAEDIHQVMIAMEQAKMAMQLTVQVRNKVVEAYQEVSRMQL
ncbi:flagellar hook-basal body complex protein FliE [Dethiobacter alkaliphilus]|uniref:flagellar hook-basal body complex protein FliE n=1 Tax=Dethiobacter alkaliphilus TaxID=427926 RepID=UPI002227D18C|nr:flagellar hook-basal body complex protein FliE [Dethiobacter alkaliphilus]MCW3488749.1 flagellar hook-basal body complex protein FliE [Dethiobacter alkaliphilus]